jgi:hypothetical protein
MQSTDLRAQSDTLRATIRQALRTEPGLQADGLDEDGIDLAWVTWGPLDGNGYLINAGVNEPGLGHDVSYGFVSAGYLDGERSERVICLAHVAASNLGDGTALAGRLLDALRADRDRPRCAECKGSGGWGSDTCGTCGGPGFVGTRGEFIDFTPDPNEDLGELIYRLSDDQRAVLDALAASDRPLNIDALLGHFLAQVTSARIAASLNTLAEEGFIRYASGDPTSMFTARYAITLRGRQALASTQED